MGGGARLEIRLQLSGMVCEVLGACVSFWAGSWLVLTGCHIWDKRDKGRCCTQTF